MKTFEVPVKIETSGTVTVRANDEAEAMQFVNEYFWASCANAGDSGCNSIKDWNIDFGCDIEALDNVVELEDDDDEEENTDEE